MICKVCSERYPLRPATLTTTATSVDECVSSGGAYMARAKSGRIEAYACPEGALCNTAGVTPETFVLLPGYWRATANSTKVLPCPYPRFCWGGNGTRWEWGPGGIGDESSRAVLEGQPGYGDGGLEYAQEDEGSGDTPPARQRQLQAAAPVSSSEPAFDPVLNGTYCAPHHVGIYCVECEPGYVLRGIGYCEMCDEASQAQDNAVLAVQIVVVLVLVFLVMGCVLAYMRRKLRIKRMREANGDKDDDGALANSLNFMAELMAKGKILLGLAQVMASFGTTFVGGYPPEVLILLDKLSIVGLDLARFISFGCSVSSNFYSKLLVYTLVPILVLAILGAVYGIAVKCAGDDPKAKDDLRGGTITALLFITFLVYPGVSSMVLLSFKCESFEDGSYVLSADYSINCNDPLRIYWIVYALVCVAVYPVGIVVLYFVLLWRAKDRINPKGPDGEPLWGKVPDDEVLAIRDSDPSIQHLQLLFKAYEPPYLLYEVAELVRSELPCDVLRGVSELTQAPHARTPDPDRAHFHPPPSPPRNTLHRAHANVHRHFLFRRQRRVGHAGRPHHARVHAFRGVAQQLQAVPGRQRRQPCRGRAVGARACRAHCALVQA